MYAIHPRNDIVNPLGDPPPRRIQIVYDFDLDKDILSCSSPEFEMWIALDRLRDSSIVRVSDFTSSPPIALPSVNNSAFIPPHWTPTTTASSRRLAFVSRILSDFNYQWRHILRRPYRESTFRTLAIAVIRIASLDFTVVEDVTRWDFKSAWGSYVQSHELPAWEGCQESIFNIDNAIFILERDLEDAMKSATKYNTDRKVPKGTAEQQCEIQVYILLTVRHIMLFHMQADGTVSYTKPTPFLNGAEIPSTEAVSLLLQGLTFGRPANQTTKLHTLPLEIQDHILAYLSEGPIESARRGCLLELGSPYAWIRKSGWTRQSGEVRRHETHTHRSDSTPVESKIHFGKTFSGISYI
ncbi:hypothetical protein B0J14DRAFT_293303 [Halenospora varia]|nr:hypothetical protein B0J14DRAFT_293303 [Halenospora varia]